MKLQIFPRVSNKKSDPKSNRRRGEIPCVLYGLKQANRNVLVKKDDVDAAMRHVPKGFVATTMWELQEGEEVIKALVKEIQYHATTYEILHIDFLRLSDREEVTLNVPIHIVGETDCTGIKLGGFLRRVIRTMKVRCLPRDIPREFTLDVRELNIAASKTLGDIALPAGVRPLAQLKEVAVVIAKKV